MSPFSFVVLLFFIAYPLLSIPFVIIGYFYEPRYRLLYSAIFGLFLGLVAYSLDPPMSYDLFRHHELVLDAMRYAGTISISALITTGSEPVQALTVYLVSLTRDPNILQFSLVWLGYVILLWCIGDFAKRNNIRKRTLLLVLFFTLSSFTAINFFSGLWNYIAMLLFSLGFYLDVYRGKSRWITYPLYCLTPFIHSGMFFPVVLLAIFKVFKGKLNILSVGVSLGLFAAPAIILPVVNGFMNIPLLAQIEPMYLAYFVEGDQFMNLYGGSVMAMETLKLTLYGVISLYLYRGLKRKKDQTRFKAVSFAILLMLVTTVLVINSIVFLRFVLLVQFLSAPLLMQALDRKNTLFHVLVVVYMIVLSVLFCTYQYMTLSGLDFGPINLNNILVNSWQLLHWR